MNFFALEKLIKKSKCLICKEELHFQDKNIEQLSLYFDAWCANDPDHYLLIWQNNNGNYKLSFEDMIFYDENYKYRLSKNIDAWLTSAPRPSNSIGDTFIQIDIFELDECGSSKDTTLFSTTVDVNSFDFNHFDIESYIKNIETIRLFG